MILKVAFFILFLLPITFQILFGIKAIKGKFKLKLWQVSIFSCIGQVIITVVNFFFTSSLIKHVESHDGLPMVGVVFISSIFSALILFVILAQIIVSVSSKKNKQYQ